MRTLTRLPFYRPAHLSRPVLSRPFSSIPRLQLRENAEQSPEDLEQKKQKQAQTGEKSRDLKSAGEEAVGADQENVKDDQKHIEELQKQTANESQKEKEGKK